MCRVVLDTNIILLDANNLIMLGSTGDTVVIPETVLAELDSKKSGMTELAYQARSFGRLLTKCKIQDIVKTIEATITTMTIDGVSVEVVALNKYEIDTAADSRNDQKIQAVASYMDKIYGNVTVISNDVLMRLRCMADGLDVTDLKIVEDVAYEFVKELVIDDPEVFRTLHNKKIQEVDSEYSPENFGYTFTCSNTSQVKLGIVNRGVINILGKDTEKEVRRQDVNPIGYKQLMLGKAIQSGDYDLIMVEAAAGTGKTTSTLSNAMKLVKQNNKYDGIIYMRNSVTDVEINEEIGFLPGSEDEKTRQFLHPVWDTLDYIARNRHQNSSMKPQEYEEMIEGKVRELADAYNIETMTTIGVRGRTFTNKIWIVDEIQNISKSQLQKLLTRVGKNCMVILTGSMKQIDNPYITKYNNGLSVVLNACREEQQIDVYATTLDKVVRSEMSEWAEKLFSK